jgi:lipooligosaccharide transport system permease protein
MSATSTTAPAAPAMASPLLLGRATYLLERNVMVYRRSWLILFSGFFEPVFYLFAIGIGLGQLVGEVGAGGQTLTYAAFVAPALLAASAMNGAVYESTFNIFFKLKYMKTYDAMLATPIEPRDVAVGEITWSLIRGALYASGFLIVMGLIGLIDSWWGLLALPAALLIGLAFGAVGMAVCTWMRSWQDFDLVQMVILPLFLFSATFFPLDVYPRAIQPLVQLSPLYHGVQLVRGLSTGTLDWSLLAHAGVQVAMGVLGLAVTARFQSALQPK